MRAGGEGEGDAARGFSSPAAGARDLLLSPAAERAAAHAHARRAPGDGDRLRNGARCPRRLSAACADVGDLRTHGGKRHLPLPSRARRPRARPRCRQCGNERCANRSRTRHARDAPHTLGALTRCGARRRFRVRARERGIDRGRGARGGSRRRRGPRSRATHAEAPALAA